MSLAPRTRGHRRLVLKGRSFDMKNYDKIQVLVTKSKSGEDTAFEELLKHFKPLITSQAMDIYANGYDLDDIIQVEAIALFKAVLAYDATNENFSNYATAAIKNNLKNLTFFMMK